MCINKDVLLRVLFFVFVKLFLGEQQAQAVPLSLSLRKLRVLANCAAWIQNVSTHRN